MTGFIRHQDNLSWISPVDEPVAQRTQSPVAPTVYPVCVRFRITHSRNISVCVPSSSCLVLCSEIAFHAWFFEFLVTLECFFYFLMSRHFAGCPMKEINPTQNIFICAHQPALLSLLYFTVTQKKETPYVITRTAVSMTLIGITAQTWKMSFIRTCLLL